MGEILRIDDVITGFDDNKPGRPCMVVAVVERPRAGAWVLPRSTRGRDGTFVPAGVAGLNQDGRFMFLPRFVARADLEGAVSLGRLPEPHRQRVLDNVNMADIDLEDDL